MKEIKNIKIIIGLIYLLFIIIFLYFFFSKYSLQEITTYKFIQVNREYLINIRDSNLFLLSVGFIFIATIWYFILGFGTPPILVAGFIFGKWIGFFLSVVSLAVGSFFLYIFANYFLGDLVKEKLSNRFKFLEQKFKKNEFTFFLIFRFVGGVPFQIASLLPVLFNMKPKNYFFATLFGVIPHSFVTASLGSGIEKVIKNNDSVPGLFELLSSPEIYLPVLGFFLLISITLIIKKFFYKN